MYVDPCLVRRAASLLVITVVFVDPHSVRGSVSFPWSCFVVLEHSPCR